MTNLDTFVNLAEDEIARRVREQGQQVCIFPITGIQHWFTTEFGSQLKGDWIENYTEKVSHKLLDRYSMFFDLGIATLISPIQGAELLFHASEEMQIAGAQRLERLTMHPDFLCFYEKFGVRVHFYGDYRRQLTGTPYSYLIEQFDLIARHTRKNTRHRLFYGVFAGNAAENIAELSVRHFIQTGKIPDRRTLSELYYGENIETADLFVSFDSFRASDYPLLNIDEDDLYLTVTPSFYLEAAQLRRIIYDHLYQRDVRKSKRSQMSDQDIAAMKAFYHSHRETTLGFGQIQAGVWAPNLQG